MSSLQVPEIIEVGDISVPLSANYQADASLFGTRFDFTAPTTIAVVTDALRWQWAAFPDHPEVRAVGYLTIDTIGDIGDIITVYVNDPFLGVITLGGYTLSSLDTTTNLIASHLGTALAANSYGYAVSFAFNVITIVAAEGTGALINGNNNLFYTVVSIVPGSFIATEGDDPIITENDLNLIIE